MPSFLSEDMAERARGRDLGVVGGSLTRGAWATKEKSRHLTGAVSRMLDENGRSICGIEGAGTQSWWDSGGISKSQMCKHTPMHGTQRPGRCLDGSCRRRAAWWLRLTGIWSRFREQKGGANGKEGVTDQRGKGVSRKMLREARRETHEEMPGWLGPRPCFSGNVPKINKWHEIWGCDVLGAGSVVPRFWVIDRKVFCGAWPCLSS